MRLFPTVSISFVVASLCWSGSAWAQMGTYTKGSCVLADGRQLQGGFQLRLATAQSPAILVYHDSDGKQPDQEFEPAQIKRCTVGRRSYIVGGNFVAPDNKGGIPVDKDFVEVLDTLGRVQTFRYTYEGYVSSNPGDYILPVALAATSLAVGGPMVFLGGGGKQYQPTYILLLRAGNGQPLVPYTPGPQPGLFTSEQEKLIMPSVGATTAFFTDDPELQRRIETGRITQVRLPEVVQAYNTGIKLKPKN
ncbi:hypothetical protein [Hymenobacter sediminicola]|uniref:Uncharacterized protein n=1 Tax=Hymenobacter sediminicola TaxID=2761579 RepID=A0A7G7WAP4_9BACT|nr:hypothetical protein [Hymenobacter sediminicola]QNH63437.1 hypothetical protein H4317_06475 [Hymenobacter sediminicola]